jgi:GT2 family glycosyltransferase
LLIDNGSDPNLTKLFRRKIYFDVMKFPTNIGLTKAWNMGLEFFKPSDVVFVGSDVTFFNKNWLTRLISTAKENPTWGMIHSHCLREHDKQEDSRYTKYYPRDREIVTTVRRIRHDCLYIKRALIDCIGLYDENMFVYGSDVDIVRRTKNAGWQLGYCGTSKVMHYHGLSSRRFNSSVKASDDLYLKNKWNLPSKDV